MKGLILNHHHVQDGLDTILVLLKLVFVLRGHVFAYGLFVSLFGAELELALQVAKRNGVASPMLT